MATIAERNVAARGRLLVVTAMMLEALHEPSAEAVLSMLKPADMRPGGARVPGTSYELDAPLATQVMQALLARRNGHADALLAALAEADIAGRFAVLKGTEPPRLASLYAFCTADTTAAGAESLETALKRLYQAANQIFTLTQMRRIDAQVFQWKEDPQRLDAMPVQQFVARWVRNTP